jgi:hypothetical protein
MAADLKPGRHGDWRVRVGKGAAAFGRDGFGDMAAATRWADMAGLAIKTSTIRLGTKRLLGTAAEALRRWSIDQGTMPAAEGGTHIAPVMRLADLLADPACALPLAALGADDLVGLRARRRIALADEAAMLLEQAALSVAIDDLIAFYLPALGNPFLQAASDGLAVLPDAECSSAIALSLRMDAELSRAVALILTTGISPAILLDSRHCDADDTDGRLVIAGGLTRPWPSGLPFPDGDSHSPLLDSLTAERLEAGITRIGIAMDNDWLMPATLWLTGLSIALRDGLHLDEAMVLAGLHLPAHGEAVMT